ncbi:hypothetical protein ACFLTW_05790, partial [Chloroflexota bacterium]
YATSCFPFLNYFLDRGMAGSALLGILNLDKYNSLSPKNQEAMKQARINIEQEMTYVFKGLAAEARTEAILAGLMPVIPLPEDIDEWRAISYSSGWEVMKEKMDADSVTKLKSFMAPSEPGRDGF